MSRDHTPRGEVDLLAEIDGLPEEERAEIQARAEELNRQVQALKQLRQHAERSQKDVAEALGIKQPSVSKIEAQADMYLSTLRDYIEALGGSLKLVIDLPDHGRIELDDLADLSNRQRSDVGPTGDSQPADDRFKVGVGYKGFFNSGKKPPFKSDVDRKNSKKKRQKSGKTTNPPVKG